MKRAVCALLLAAALPASVFSAGCNSTAAKKEAEFMQIPGDDAGVQQALVLLRDGRVDEALSMLRRARQIKPYDPAVPTALGLALMAKNDYKGAIKMFTDALELDQNMAEARNNRGVALLQIGRLDEAAADFSVVVASSSPTERLNANFNMGLLLRRQGNLSEAERAFSAVVAQDPRYRRAYKERGFTRLAMDNFRAALQDFLEILKEDPSDASVNYSAALCLLATGRRDLANGYMERTASLAPESEEGKKAKRFIDNERALVEPEETQ